MSVEMIEGGIYRRRDGVVMPPANETFEGVYNWRVGCDNYTDEGKFWKGGREDPRDLIELIAPAASVDNGDGTTTKVCTIPVTMKNETWETHDVAEYREVKKADWFDANGGTGALHKRESSELNYGPRLILTPKTLAVDPYWPKLADAIDKGECEIPSRAMWMLYQCGMFYHAVNPRLYSPTDIPAGTVATIQQMTGVYPAPKGEVLTIDLSAFRKFHAERGGE